LVIRRGTVVLLCGPSGGGKSTLLRLLLGLVPQLSGGSLNGEVEVLGLDPTVVPPRDMAAAGVGLLFQNPIEGFVAERVLDEVAFGPENLGLPGAEVERRAMDALRSVGLVGFERRRLRTLSTGEQQRVALAGALALRPSLLLLDEPTAHLDEATAREILKLAIAVTRERGTTLVLGEHRLGLVAPLVDEVLVLSDGRLLSAGPPRRALADPMLAAVGVPVPRATQVAIGLGLRDMVPLTPDELAGRLVNRGSARPLPASGAGPHSREVALSFEGVSFRYPGAGANAVTDLTFTLHSGEIGALMGPSGAGKSTVARLALGLLRPSRGRITLCGLRTDETPFGLLAARGGLVLQNPLLQLLTSSVEQELRLGLSDLPGNEIRSRADELLAMFGLSTLRRKHPLALSEGQRRRVTLAAALARRPRILVLDEPTLGQDELQRQALEDLLRRLAADNTAILCITHDAELMNDVAARVLSLDRGRLVADLPLDHTMHHHPDRLRAAGLPLADVPATTLALRSYGREIGAVRTVAQLVDVFQ